MPRNVTVTFNDGSSHVYNGVPDDAQPQSVIDRAGKEFAGKQITNIDGGKAAAPQDNGPEYVPAYEGDPYMTGRDVGQMARGAVSGVLGIPGNLEKEMLRGTTKLGLTSPNEKPILPSSDDVDHTLFGKPSTSTRDAGYRELGGVAGTVATPNALSLAGKGAKAAVTLGGIIPKAIGRESTAAASALSAEAKEGISGLVADAEKKVATKSAVDSAVAGRPAAKVLEVSRPNIDTNKVTQARTAVRDTNRQLSEAQTKLSAAQRNLSSLDKYATDKRSEPMIRAARRELNKTQAEVDRLTLARDEAMTAAKETDAAHKTALQEAKRGERQETTTAGKIARESKRAEGQVISLKKLAGELNAAKQPSQIATSARTVGERLFKAGKFSQDQYTQYLTRVNEMVEKAGSTAEARKRLVTLLRGAGLAAIGGTALGYEIRRFM